MRLHNIKCDRCGTEEILTPTKRGKYGREYYTLPTQWAVVKDNIGNDHELCPNCDDLFSKHVDSFLLPNRPKS